MRRKKIGTMDFHGSVDITDPCYNRDVWCRMTDVKIRNGVYTCIAWHHKDKGTFDNGEPYCYDVIGIIGIYLDGVIPCQKDMKEIGSIGVDAGLAGFFHNKPDYTDDEWAAFCDRVRHGDAWLIKEGFYSSSGYGDEDDHFPAINIYWDRDGGKSSELLCFAEYNSERDEGAQVCIGAYVSDEDETQYYAPYMAERNNEL